MNLIFQSVDDYLGYFTVTPFSREKFDFYQKHCGSGQAVIRQGFVPLFDVILDTKEGVQ